MTRSQSDRGSEEETRTAATSGAARYAVSDEADVPGMLSPGEAVGRFTLSGIGSTSITKREHGSCGCTRSRSFRWTGQRRSDAGLSADHFRCPYRLRRFFRLTGFFFDLPLCFGGSSQRSKSTGSIGSAFGCSGGR